MIEYLKLIRIHQWTKNLFIFAPLFFSGQFFEIHKLSNTIIGFLSYCLAASSVYIINDYVDAKNDKLHPVKKNRPIASGKIKKINAISLFTLLLVISSVSSIVLNTRFTLLLGIYFLINFLYTFKLKEIAVLDIFIISLGFVLRIASGGILAEILVSDWLYIMTFLLALFISFAKRRDDVLILMKSGSQTRTSVKGYNLEFISSAVSILSAVLIVAYLLYVTSPGVNTRFEGKSVYISTIFVILGVLRYLQITLVESNSGSPTRILFEDQFIKLTVLSWILYFLLVIYFI